MTTQVFDRTRAEAVAGQMIEVAGLK